MCKFYDYKRISTYHGVDACNHSIQNKDEEDLIVCMADAITYPNAVVILTIKRYHFNTLSRTFEIKGSSDNIEHTYHSQNTSFANTAMMCTRRFIVRTLLTVPQVSSLAKIPKIARLISQVLSSRWREHNIYKKLIQTSKRHLSLIPNNQFNQYA